MNDLHLVILITLFAGLAMPLGAAISAFEHIKNRSIEDDVRHGTLAFGGGALLSAVAFVLVPESVDHVSPTVASLCILAGGVGFMLLDIFLTKRNTPASNLCAMLSDFVPESIALGAAFVTGNKTVFLLAGLIALQNIPEGFSAYRELMKSKTLTTRRILLLFTLASLLGPIAGISGYLWLSNYPTVVAAIMLFASGGILYSIFQDIAPQVKIDNHWIPPLGAVLGFLCGVLGMMLTK